MNNNAIKLPFHFSEEMLLKDLAYCKSVQFVDHYNTDDYEGSWKSISLRSSDGLSQNIKAFDPLNDGWMNTPLLEGCTFFQEIIDLFKCNKYAVRLLNLKPGSHIKEHTDHNLGYSDGTFRVHIAITTNDKVKFIIGGKMIPMRVGECWYGDFNIPHSVSNPGVTERIHLTLDCKRNEWSDRLFGDAGYDFGLENKPKLYDEATKRGMLASLQHIDSEAARVLVVQIKKELGQKIDE